MPSAVQHRAMLSSRDNFMQAELESSFIYTKTRQAKKLPM